MADVDDDEEYRATRKLNGADICVGDYVRTKTGNITKVLKIKDTVIWTEDFIDIFCRYNEGVIEKIDILKHSPNIIELIECGDYVNGSYVIQISKTFGYIFIEEMYFDEVSGEEKHKFIKKEDIKTVVTHEQFNSIMYKVEE